MAIQWSKQSFFFFFFFFFFCFLFFFFFFFKKKNRFFFFFFFFSFVNLKFRLRSLRAFTRFSGCCNISQAGVYIIRNAHRKWARLCVARLSSTGEREREPTSTSLICFSCEISGAQFEWWSSSSSENVECFWGVLLSALKDVVISGLLSVV
jgi:hypothetical protein